jgi:hypothetical protein
MSEHLWVLGLLCLAGEAVAEPTSAPSSEPASVPTLLAPEYSTGAYHVTTYTILPQWTISVDPLTTALGFAHVQIERVLAPKLSIYFGPHLHVYKNVFSKAPEDYTGVGAEIGLRRFLKPYAPTGFWGQVRGVLAHVSLDNSGTKKTGSGGYVSALVGYTWIFGGRLILAGGAGVQYINYQIAGQGLEGVLPALHTNIGFAF